MVKVYIAAPMGGKEENTKYAISVANQLLDMGYTPFCPHLTHYWDLLYPRLKREWLSYDLEWLRDCDCVLRLPGESKGADIEEECALSIGKPVYYSIGELTGAITKRVI